MRNTKVSEMTVMAMFVAIIVVMALIPQVGFFQYGGIAFTLLHIPVIIGTIYGGPKFGLSLGFAFGLFSMIVAFMLPDPANVIFQNPVVAIAPRMIFGLVTWYIFVGLKRLSDFRLRVALTFLLGTLVHTVVTLSFVILFLGFFREFIGEFINLIIIVFPLNGTIEIVTAVLVGTPVIMALWRSAAFHPPHDEGPQTEG